MKTVIILFILFLSQFIYSQDVDIIPYLKQIEDGNKKVVEAELPSLIAKNPDSPSIMFLEGVLTNDGNKAIVTYSKILINILKAGMRMRRFIEFFLSITQTAIMIKLKKIWIS